MKSRRFAPLAALVLLYVAALAALAATPAPPAPVPAAAPASGSPGGAVAAAPAAARQVVAYYFHTTQRCATCRRIEQWSGEAIRAEFAAQLADSTLLFLPVNTDEKGNEHFLEDYQLFTKALVVVEMRDGRPGAWKNLQKVWEHTGDQEKFFAYVQGEIRAALATKE